MMAVIMVMVMVGMNDGNGDDDERYAMFVMGMYYIDIGVGYSDR